MSSKYGHCLPVVFRLLLLCSAILFVADSGVAQRPEPRRFLTSSGAQTPGYCPSNGGDITYERIENITYHLDGDFVYFVVEIYLTYAPGCNYMWPECINGWIDWNGDEHWDPAERVIHIQLHNNLGWNGPGILRGYAQAMVPPTFVARPNMRLNLSWATFISDPCELSWGWGDVRDLSIDLGTFDITRLIVASNGNRVREIPDNIIWERELDGSCASSDLRSGYDEYPFSGAAGSTVMLESEITACPPREQAPRVSCDWLITPISHVGTATRGSVAETATWTLDIPIDAPAEVGIYDVMLNFNVAAENGPEVTKVIQRKLFVTLRAPLTNSPIDGNPKRQWYEKACLWGSTVSSDSPAVDSAAVDLIRSQEYSYGRARWRYGYRFESVLKCDWKDLIEESLCNYSDCYTFAEILVNLCSVLGVGDLTPTEEKGTHKYGFVTAKNQPSIDPEFPGNARKNDGALDRYYFLSHQLVENSGIYHDPTFNKAYSSKTEFISWNVLNKRATPITTDEGALLWVYRETHTYDHWDLCVYVEPETTVYSVAASAGTPSGKSILDIGILFTGAVTYFLVDDDGNGLAETLAADVEVEILTPGEYAIEGELRKGSTLISQQPRTNWMFGSIGYVEGPPGRYIVRVEFSGQDIYASGIDGPYDAHFFAYHGFECDDMLVNSTPAYGHSQFGEFLASIQSLTDAGVDLDGDGKYDVLRATVGILARAETDVGIVGAVRSNTTTLATESSNVSLAPGAQTIDLDFPGKSIRRAGRNGSYTVIVNLYDGDGQHISSLEHTTSVYSASDFDLGFLTPTGLFNVGVIDIDEDGLYDSLYTNIQVGVESPGTFNLISRLTEVGDTGELSGPLIAVSRQCRTLSRGITFLRSSFDGAAIRQHGVDGPYMLACIEATDTLGAAVDKVDPRCVTDPYLITQFKAGPPELSYTNTFQDEATDTDGDGLADFLRVSIEVESTGDADLLASAALFDPDGEFLVIGTGSVHATEGIPALLPIRFDGRYIYGNLVDGSFELRSVYIYHSGGVRDGIHIASIGPTAYYDHDQFEPAAVITGLIESVAGTPAVGAEVRTREFVDYTDSRGRFRLFFMQPDTVMVRASYDPPPSWRIYHDGTFVGSGDSLLVNVEIGVVDTIEFRIVAGGGSKEPDPFIDPCEIFTTDPLITALGPNFPNPFNPSTHIPFSLASRQNIAIRIYSVVGEVVASLYEGPAGPGVFEVPWDGTNLAGEILPAGIYFAALFADKRVLTRKLVIIK